MIVRRVRLLSDVAVQAADTTLRAPRVRKQRGRLATVRGRSVWLAETAEEVRTASGWKPPADDTPARAPKPAPARPTVVPEADFLSRLRELLRPSVRALLTREDWPSPLYPYQEEGVLFLFHREANIPLEGFFPAYFVFPFPVRVDVENPSAVVNRRRVGALRPSALIAAIQEERDRLERSPFNPGEFIGVLYSAWERMNAMQSAKSKVQVRQPQPLKQVYRELVPFARWRREYPESFFAYDVQRLMLSGTMAFDGNQCVLDRGRSAANALRLIDREGQERLISTVSFVEAGE